MTSAATIALKSAPSRTIHDRMAGVEAAAGGARKPSGRRAGGRVRSFRVPRSGRRSGWCGHRGTPGGSVVVISARLVQAPPAGTCRDSRPGQAAPRWIPRLGRPSGIHRGPSTVTRSTQNHHRNFIPSFRFLPHIPQQTMSVNLRTRNDMPGGTVDEMQVWTIIVIETPSGGLLLAISSPASCHEAVCLARATS